MGAPNGPEERTRSVLDPIHGLIRLTEAEVKVLDHPLFQRLRQVKQNGLLYLVFPAATHSRFEHSLGVLYVAHGMLNSLALNSAVGLAKGSVVPIVGAQPGDAVAFPAPNTEERNFIYRVTRLAALAHDLGHGPLSHTFDSFAPTRATLESMLGDPALRAVEPLWQFMLEWGTDPTKPTGALKNHRVPHEVMSCVFFTKIWHERIAGEPEIPLAVCAAILGHHDGKSTATLLSDPIARAWVPLIHDIVASAPADADRMDYMERDSRAIGVTYGLFDRNRVLKSLLCFRANDGTEPRYRLGVKRSGLQAIENLMQARYELFAQIYYHKTNRAISLMLESISEIADREMDIFASPIDVERLTKIYLDLTDDFFLRMLLGKEPSMGTIPPRVRVLMTHIWERRLWKRILEPTTDEEAEAILAILHDEFATVQESIQKDERNPKALKDLDEGAALLVRDARKVYVAGKGGPWRNASTIIKALEDADSRSVRIYFRSTDEVLASKLQERALQLAFEREAVNAAS